MALGWAGTGQWLSWPGQLRVPETWPCHSRVGNLKGQRTVPSPRDTHLSSCPSPSPLTHLLPWPEGPPRPRPPQDRPRPPPGPLTVSSFSSHSLCDRVSSVYSEMASHTFSPSQPAGVESSENPAPAPSPAPNPDQSPPRASPTLPGHRGSPRAESTSQVPPGATQRGGPSLHHSRNCFFCLTGPWSPQARSEAGWQKQGHRWTGTAHLPGPYHPGTSAAGRWLLPTAGPAKGGYSDAGH